MDPDLSPEHRRDPLHAVGFGHSLAILVAAIVLWLAVIALGQLGG